MCDVDVQSALHPALAAVRRHSGLIHARSANARTAHVFWAHAARVLGPHTGAHPTLSDSARAHSAHTRSAQLGPNVGQFKSTLLDSTLSESVVSASVACSSTVSPLVDRCPCSGLRLHTSARSERTSASISKRGTRWDVQKACVHGKHTPAIHECQSAL